MIRREVILAPAARDDLITIYDWIAEHATPDTALAYIERLESHVRGFDVVSERGTRHDHIRPGLRTIGFERDVTIAFYVTETEVVILRFLRRKRLGQPAR